MQWIRRAPVARKLALAFAMLCVLTLSAALAGGWGIWKVSGSASALYSGGTVHQRLLGEVNYLVTRSRVILIDAVMANSPANTAKRLSQFEEYSAKVVKNLKEVGANTLPGEEQRQFDELLRRHRALHDQGFELLAAALRSAEGESARLVAYKAISELNPAFTKAMEDILEAQVREAGKDFSAGEVAATQAYWAMAAALLLSVSGSIVVGWLVIRSLVRSLGGEPEELAQIAKKIAGGSLSATSNAPAFRNSVLASMQEMQVQLATLVRSVRQNAEAVATASAQIAQGNQDLSSRTEEQSSALQQTAATMDKLGAAVRRNADNSQQASQLANESSDVAMCGSGLVNHVVETMSGISDGSRKIGEIIAVIDGIAFQTNILALNAAVEAARAGESGRGFAVVAAEVRALAQRSADAAKEIKALIGRSVSQVEQGAELVDRTGHTMQGIVGSIKRVNDIVAEISVSSAEQSSGVQQVGEVIAHLDRATQQNAALVEQSAAAAESLSRQAQQLLVAVSLFELPPKSSGLDGLHA